MIPQTVLSLRGSGGGGTGAGQVCAGAFSIAITIQNDTDLRKHLVKLTFNRNVAFLLRGVPWVPLGASWMPPGGSLVPLGCGLAVS